MNTKLDFAYLLNSIQENERWTAPYGVLEGEGKSKKGKPFRSITFGIARYLDAYITYYNSGFMILKAQGSLEHLSGVYKSVESLLKALEQ